MRGDRLARLRDDVVERDRPMMIFLVPAMAELITASPRFEGADLSGPVAVSIPFLVTTARAVLDRVRLPGGADVGQGLIGQTSWTHWRSARSRTSSPG